MVVQWPLAKSFPISDSGMVAAKQPAAAEAGAQILRMGGSAVDAAIATSLAIGVVEPYMSGIGGGGLALYFPAAGDPVAIHCGMKAPKSACAGMYEIIPDSYDLDLFGWPRTAGDGNIHGPKSIAVPGLLAGLRRLWEIGGVIPWEELVRPAAQLAGSGFPADWMLSLRTLEGYDLLSQYPLAASTYMPAGRPPVSDLGLGAELVRQPDLASTLRAIAENPGALAGARIGGAISRAADNRFGPQEIAEHVPLEGAPLTIEYEGLDVHLVPWATGGATMLEWMGIVRELDPPRDDTDVRFWWAVLKAGEVALHDRLTKLADPQFVPFPREILDPSYHRRMAGTIRANEAPVTILPPDAGSTTHLSVVDAHGNAVALTQTLLSLWGSAVVADGTGICLNNGMMWFDPEPGRPNSIEGGKAPMANMCPVVVSRDGQPLLVYGASGGRRIMGALVQILLRVALIGMSLQEAMAAPRIDVTSHDIKADVRFGSEFAGKLSRLMRRPITLRDPVLGASPWGSPVGLQRLDDGQWTAGGDMFTMACAVSA